MTGAIEFLLEILAAVLGDGFPTGSPGGIRRPPLVLSSTVEYKPHSDRISSGVGLLGLQDRGHSRPRGYGGGLPRH